MQLIRLMMGYAYRIWRYAALAADGSLHVLNSNFLRLIARSPLYTGNKQTQ